MRAAVLRALGNPPQYDEFPQPVAAPGEVIVHVEAAGLHPIVKALAGGTHYGRADALPMVVGIDAAGRLDDGTRVYCGAPRHPHGTMAERAVVPASFCFPLPDGLDEATAAAGMNPGLSGWLALAWRARLVPGETVLILGATGAAGQMAVQAARLLGAARIVVAGRNETRLRDLDADATISLGRSPEEIRDDFAEEDARALFDVVLDYVWGPPTEALVAALARRGLTEAASRVRLVQIGDSASSTISLRADSLHSSGLDINGSGAGSVPASMIIEAIPTFLERLARGELRVDAEIWSLSQIEHVWARDQHGRRIVLVP